MFNTIIADAPKIVNAAKGTSVWENAPLYRKFAKEETKLEMSKLKCAWTSEHWSPPGNVTFAATQHTRSFQAGVCMLW
jgi:hypothetical protein